MPIGVASATAFQGCRKKNCVPALTTSGTPTPASFVTVMTLLLLLTSSTWPSGLNQTLLKLLLSQIRVATRVPFCWYRAAMRTYLPSRFDSLAKLVMVVTVFASTSYNNVPFVASARMLSDCVPATAVSGETAGSVG